MHRYEKEFDGFPSQQKVVSLLISNGISVREGHAYCNSIEVSDTAIGRVCNVDRRVVRTTLERISSNPDLDAVFSKIGCMLSLVDVAPGIGCSSIVIIPTDPTMGGILAAVMTALYESGISVRQAMVDDSNGQEESTLIIVVDGKVPAEIIPKLKECRGVESILIKRADRIEERGPEPPG